MASIELKFQGTFNNSDYLQEFSCGSCQCYITEYDISQGNYRLWVSDYANDLEKEEFISAYSGQKLIVYGLNFWLKAVEHLECSKGEN